MPEKYEQEIEDLLRQMGEFPPQQSFGQRLGRWAQAVPAGFRRWARTVLRELSPGRLLKLALGLLLASFLFRGMMPRFAFYAYMVGLVLLVVSIAGLVVQERSAPERRWRGRIIELPGLTASWWSQLWWRLQDYWRRLAR